MCMAWWPVMADDVLCIHAKQHCHFCRWLTMLMHVTFILIYADRMHLNISSQHNMWTHRWSCSVFILEQRKRKIVQRWKYTKNVTLILNFSARDIVAVVTCERDKIFSKSFVHSENLSKTCKWHITRRILTNESIIIIDITTSTHVVRCISPFDGRLLRKKTEVFV